MNAKTLLAASCLGFAALAPTLGHAAEALRMTVYKTPWCGCCHEWVEVMRRAGYEVETREMEDLTQVKSQAGVPQDMESCHTASLDGYFLEGHVPPEAVEKLMETRPDIAGLAVPGMPQGAPGMGDDPSARYEVYAVAREPGRQPTVFYQAGL
jgi:hypothetical protein